MTVYEYNAEIEQLNNVLSTVETELEMAECPMKLVTQICVAVEEIFVNIAHYAYEGKKGTVRLQFDSKQREICIKFIDNGIPFNPLEKEDPDITLSVQERSVGGLGIFMVKKMMDEILYEYVDGANILTLKKKF